MTGLSETFPERVARIMREQNVTATTACRIAAASESIECAVRDKRRSATPEEEDPDYHLYHGPQSSCIECEERYA